MRLTAPDEPVAVAANGEAAVSVHIRNDRDIVDGFGATVTGLAVEEVRSDSVALFPGVEADVRVQFRVSPTVPAGPRPAAIQVRSRADGTSASVPVVVVVPPRRFLTGELVPAAMATRRRATTTVVLRNHGNVVLPLELAAADPTGELHMDLARELVELVPRTTMRIPLTITGRPRFAGLPVPVMVGVTGRGEGDELLVSTSGTFTIRPLLPRWVLTFLPLLLVLLAWALILLVGVGRAIDAAVPAEGTVAGRVLSSEPGPVPVGGATVGAYPTEGASARPAASVVTKADGSFELPVPPGEYLLRAEADGFEPDAVDGVAKVKAEKGRRSPEVDLRLDGKPGSITGAVTGAKDGVAVAVEQLDAQGNPLGSGRRPMRLAAFTTDGADGVDGAGAGGADGPAPPPDPTTTTTAAPASGSSGLPPPQAVATTATDANGAFTLPGLHTPATYRLRLTKAGFQEATLTVTLAAAEDKTGIVVELVPMPGTVTGTVTVGGAAASGVDITVTNGSTTFTTKSVAGTYTVEGVPPGPWVVSASYGTLPPATASVVVTPGGRATASPFAF